MSRYYNETVPDTVIKNGIAYIFPPKIALGFKTEWDILRADPADLRGMFPDLIFRRYGNEIYISFNQQLLAV